MPQGVFSISNKINCFGFRVVLLALALTGLVISACAKETSPPEPAPKSSRESPANTPTNTTSNTASDSARPVVHTYTLRGRIVSLPDPANPASELRIHHEAIDDFKNAQGEPIPMSAMTMSFPPAPGVSLDGLAVGDVVEFVFRVQWEPTHGMGATSIKKLPADTPLSFE